MHISVVYRSHIHVLRTIYNYGLPTVHSTHLVRTCYRVVPVDIACLLVLRGGGGGALLLLPLLLHVCNLSYEEETISTITIYETSILCILEHRNKNTGFVLHKEDERAELRN